MVLKDLCDAIRREVVSVKFFPGMKLSEQMLCERWNVSRTPIREALRHLESEGFIASTPNKGFVVTSISLRDVEQAYMVMINLDSLAGRLAAPLVFQSAEKIEQLRGICEEMRFLCEKKDIEGYIKANWEFHSLIFRASENIPLIRILENIHAHANRFILKTLHIPHRINKSVREHAKILKCMETGDAKGAEKAIAAHFAKSVEDLKNEIGTSIHARSMDMPLPHPQRK